MTDETRRGGRPPSAKPKRRTSVRYSSRVAQEILERMAEGEPWKRICQDARMPAYRTLYNWREKWAAFDAAVRRAQEMGADYRADEALEVAERATPATVTADRLRFDALKWHTSRLGPRPRSEGADERPTRLVIQVKRFERAVRPDGTTYVREAAPKGRGRR